MPDFGFVGAAYEAPSIYQDAQQCYNWYPEVDPNKISPSAASGGQNQRGVIALYPTPGLSLLTATQYGPVRGLATAPGGLTLLAVVGNTLYSVSTSYVATAVGTLRPNTGTGKVYIVYILDTILGLCAYLTDGNNRYYYRFSNTTLTVISDGPFTSGGVCTEMDNFVLYTNPNTNKFGQTDVSSVFTTVLPLAQGAKIGGSDNLVSMIADKRYLYLLGERTSEVWQDAGTSPLAFSIIPGTSMEHGIVAQDSIARLGESIAFLERDERGINVVVQMTGYQPKRISTHAVENELNKYPTTSDAIAYTYQQSGHEFYMLSFPTADVTWCYDLATQLWHKRAWRDSGNVLHRHRSNVGCAFNGLIVVGDWQNGNLYSLTQSIYTDNGDLIPCIRRCPHLTQDLRYQFFSRFQIQFQPGVGSSGNPQAMLRWSDDGGSTYGNIHVGNLGKIGQYKNRCQWNRLGMARDRIFEVTVTDPVIRTIISANLEMTSGAT